MSYKIIFLVMCLAYSITSVGQKLKAYKDPGTAKYGFREQGKTDWAIPPIYDFATDFEKDYLLACVRYQGKYGYIDSQNQFIIQPVYDYATSFYQGVAKVEQAGKYYVINYNGEKVSPYFSELNHYSLYGKELDGYFRMYNAKFQPVDSRKYDDLEQITYQDGNKFLLFYKYRENDRTGYLDQAGGEFVKTDYTLLEAPLVFYASVEEKCEKDGINKERFQFLLPARDANGKYGCINFFNEVIIPFDYDSELKLYKSYNKHYKKILLPFFTEQWNAYISNISNALTETSIAFSKLNRELRAEYPMGIKRKVNNLTINKRANGVGFYRNDKPVGGVYKEIDSWGTCFLLTGQNGLLGVANLLGKEVLACQFDNVSIWNILEGGNILLVEKNGKSGLYDTNGTILTPMQYDVISTSVNKVGFAYDKNGYKLIGPDGRVASRKTYHRIDHYTYKNKIIAELAGYKTELSIHGQESPSIAGQAFDEAYNLPNSSAQEKYDKYVLCMALDPDNTEGYYAISLNNIGALFEDLGDVDKALSYYAQARDKGNEQARKNIKRIRRDRTLAALSQALTQVSESLNQTSQSLNNVNVNQTMQQSNGYANNMMMGNPYSGYGGGMYNSESYNSDNSKHSLSFYQMQYANWEERARSIYESLTSSGYQIKEKDTDKDVGGGSAGSWGIVSSAGMKSNLRTAQREMRKVRQEASRDGYNIPISNYENITVSF